MDYLSDFDLLPATRWTHFLTEVVAVALVAKVRIRMVCDESTTLYEAEGAG